MRKLRYIAPAVAATAAAGMVLGQALPAYANTKSKSCGDQLCLWYSHGTNSPVFGTNANHIANLENYDFAGTDKIVRNDAHSAADQGDAGAFSDYLFVYINYGTPEYFLSLFSTSADNQANTLVPGIINNEASYYDSLY